MNKNIEIIEFKNYNIGIFQNILLVNQGKSPRRCAGTAGGCLFSTALMDDEPLKVQYVRFHIRLDRKYRKVRFPVGNG